jgi:TonB family protein
MAGTVSGLTLSQGPYRNRLVVTGTAAQLRMGDHQMVNPALPLWLATCLLLAASRAGAEPWPACNAPGLVPVAAVEQPAPPYPESARLAGAEGFVEVAFTVLRDGQVGWVRVLRAQPPGFFEAAALEGVRAWRFAPATRDGTPVECRVQTRVRYALSDTVAARPAGTAGTGDQPAPVYPDAARIEGLEGYVEVEFEVTPEGGVANARVATAMPRGAFEEAALAAVRRWRFPPGSAAGTALTRRFGFALPDRYPHEARPTLLAAAPLPAEACARRQPGWVRLEVEVDADGRVSAAKVVASEPAGLYDTTALAVARNSRLDPAWRGGVAVAATGLLTLRFEPDETRCGGPSPGDPQAPARGRAIPRVSATGAGPGARR